MQNQQDNHTDPEELIGLAGQRLLGILAENLQQKSALGSLELLTVVGTLTGQLVLRDKLGGKLESRSNGERVLVDGVSDRVFEIHNIIRYNCEQGPLAKALEDRALTPADPTLTAEVLLESLPKIEAVFRELQIPKAHTELTGAMAILTVIQKMDDELREDISGTLSLVTHAMVAGSHTVIR